MKMPMVSMPKREPEPIGHEISVNVGKFKDLAEYKVGDKVEVKIEAVIVGQHMHNIGKSKEHMYDIKITDFECEGMEEEDDDEESDAK